MARCGKIHNILILENHLGMGGLEKKLYDFIARIDRSHYHVVICCLKEAGHLRDPFIGLGVPLHERLSKHKLDVFAFARLLRIFAHEEVELVYTLPHPNSVIFASMARRLGRVRRVVVSVHGTGGPLGGRMVRRYLKPFFGGVDRFIAVAEEHRRYLIESEELPAEKVAVIHNGVDVVKFHPAPGGDPAFRTKLGAAPEDRVVATVASLHHYKGVDVFLKAAPEVLRVSASARFVVVGDGPERGALERLSAALGVSGRVTFTGIRSDVDEILRESEFFVLSSRTEAFPNVILEAMATALPVVASDVGSVHELVEEGTTGYRVPPDDPETLSRRIIDLLRDAGSARAFGLEARRVVESRFKLEGMCEKREALFAELLCR
jgi:glycosyltransferase involved in cell wall biosynthesis